MHCAGIEHKVRIPFALALFFVSAVSHRPATAAGIDPQTWVAVHNEYRTLHQVGPVVWSASLAASAQAWANTCPSGHSSGNYGENIYWSTDWSDDARDVIGAWYSEEKAYDYNNPGFSPATGHFTQLVWKATTAIGCGMATGCATALLPNVWVCQYSPPGNVIGQFADNVFPPKQPAPTPTPTGQALTVPPILELLLERGQIPDK